MPNLPAFCDTCGGIFASSFACGSGERTRYEGNWAGPCPHCGAKFGHIPDGIYNFIGETIEVVRAFGDSKDKLLRLAKTLEEARKRGETRERIVFLMEEVSPVLSAWAKLLPENKKELYGYVKIVIAVIALLKQGSLNHSENVTNITNINQINNITNIQVIEQMYLDNERDPPAKKRKKIGRNERCFCGSGQKYKKCCGRLN